MKIRATILAGGEGSRLGILTEKRTKPAVPFAGKYRIIDFALSNLVNSGIFDVMLVAQYRPQSLIEHIGAGGPWDLNRDFTGGIRILTPYKARRSADWFTGTADAVQQNFSFIKRNNPDLVLLLSGDHIYTMDYEPLITFHLDHQAEVTMATIRVPKEEASRFGVVATDNDYRVTSFIEKPKDPPSTLINMGVYIFNLEILDKAMWEDHKLPDSSHDFGKDVIPKLIRSGAKVFAYPYSGYWVDVGTIGSYWQAHMDLLVDPAPIDLNRRDWIIHTRTEERPPVMIYKGATVEDSMITDGCVIEAGAVIRRSVLSPGVIVRKGAVIEESILLTDSYVGANSSLYRTVLDKLVCVGENVQIGSAKKTGVSNITMVGKSSILPNGLIVEAGARIGTNVIESDFASPIVPVGEIIKSRRLPYEV